MRVHWILGCFDRGEPQGELELSNTKGARQGLRSDRLIGQRSPVSARPTVRHQWRFGANGVRWYLLEGGHRTKNAPGRMFGHWTITLDLDCFRTRKSIGS